MSAAAQLDTATSNRCDVRPSPLPRFAPPACLVLALAIALPASAADPAAKQAGNWLGATYYRIEIKDDFQSVLTVERIRALEQEIRLRVPTAVVVEINSIKGDIGQAYDLVRMIRSLSSRHRVIGLLRQARSAAVPVCLACKEIYLLGEATLGAATSLKVAPDGTVAQATDGRADYEQRMVVRMIAEAAGAGGHDRTLAEAMADPAFALTTRVEREKRLFEKDGQGETLKAKGKLLILDDDRMIEYELAAGQVDGLEELGRKLGMPDWLDRSGKPAGPPAGAAELYHMLLAKAEELKLTDANLTDMQRKLAEEQMVAWFKQHNFVGREVDWTFTLLDMSDKPVRDQIEQIKRNIESNKRITESRFYREYQRSTVRKKNEENRDLARQAKALADFPYTVTATAYADGPVQISALFAAQDKDYLVRVPRGGELRCTARVQDVDFVRSRFSREPTFTLKVKLEACKVFHVKKARPADAPVQVNPPMPKPTDTPEQKAREKFNLARTYSAAGMNEKARALLEEVIRDYPQTESAGHAREQLRLLGKGR